MQPTWLHPNTSRCPLARAVLRPRAVARLYCLGAAVVAAPQFWAALDPPSPRGGDGDDDGAGGAVVAAVAAAAVVVVVLLLLLLLLLPPGL